MKVKVKVRVETGRYNMGFGVKEKYFVLPMNSLTSDILIRPRPGNKGEIGVMYRTDAMKKSKVVNIDDFGVILKHWAKKIIRARDAAGLSRKTREERYGAK